MRVSSLSDSKVVDLLKKYFVSAWLSRDFYQKADNKAERQEILRIDRDVQRKKLDGGNVAAFVIDWDGTVLDAMKVHRASKPENLVPMLQKVIDAKKVQPRSDEAIKSAVAAAQERYRPKEEGGKIFHTWTRFTDNRAGYGVSEDWVELPKDQWEAFLPPKDAKTGTSWQVADQTIDKLAVFFYPPAPSWQVEDSEILSRKLTATVQSINKDVAEITLRGEVVLNHPFGTKKETPGKATVPVIGFARCDFKDRTLKAFALTSEDAKFVWKYQGTPQPQTMAIAVELDP
jgi:hypothetical protein